MTVKAGDHQGEAPGGAASVMAVLRLSDHAGTAVRGQRAVSRCWREPVGNVASPNVKEK